jgi:transposase
LPRHKLAPSLYDESQITVKCVTRCRPNEATADVTLEQQGCLMLHRTRHLFVRQQTAAINAIRAHLAEFGIVAPVGRHGVEELLNVAADRSDKRMPEVERACLAALGAQQQMLKTQILQFDRLIMAWHRSNEASKRLDDIPGVGPALATALVAKNGVSKRSRPELAAPWRFSEPVIYGWTNLVSCARTES